jgi:uncharacterized protein (TIGR03546 family)
MQLGKRLRDALLAASSHRRPWQIALAVTCGLLLGLLPKASGLFVLSVVACFVLPVHFPLLAITAVIVSMSSPVLEPHLGNAGIWTLTQSPLSAFLLRLDALPLVPWAGFHNSLVLGSLFVWLALSVPVYATSLTVARVAMPALDTAPAIPLFRRQSAAVSSTPDPMVNQEQRAMTGVLEPGPKLTLLEPPTVVFAPVASPPQCVPGAFELDKPNYLDDVEESEITDFDLPSRTEMPSTDEIIRRSAQLAEWAEEAIATALRCDASPATADASEMSTKDRASTQKTGAAGIPPSPTVFTAPDPLQQIDEFNARDNDRDAGDDQWLIETTMEVVRIAERAVSQQANRKLKTSYDNLADDLPIETTEKQVVSPSDSQEKLQISTPNSMQDALNVQNDFVLQTGKMPSGNGERAPALTVGGRSDMNDSIRRQQPAHGETGNHYSVQNTSHDQPREEALRYLLRHLKGIQDKAQKQ